MRKVTEVKYLWNNEQPTEYVVNEVKCGIITEGKGFTDLCINDRKIEEVEEILQDYMEDEEIDDLEEYLEKNNIEYQYIKDGFFTLEEFLEKYDEDTVLIDVVNHEARTPYDYYYTCEEIYTYSYWDTNGCEVMELTSEGTEVEKIKTIEKGDTYTKDLYYDTEDKEYFVVFNSFFEGSFLTVEEYLDEDEVKKYMDK